MFSKVKISIFSCALALLSMFPLPAQGAENAAPQVLEGGPEYDKQIEHFRSPTSMTEVLKAIKVDLETYPYHPGALDTKEYNSFKLDGFGSIALNQNFVRALVYISFPSSLNKNVKKQMLMVNKDLNTNQYSVKRLFLTSDANLMSFQLFNDVSGSLSVVIQNNNYGPNGVLIETTQETREGIKLQDWSLCNESGCDKYKVTLTPDGQGGNYFSVRK